MLRQVAKLGVKRTLFVSIALALAIAGTSTAFAVIYKVREALEQSVLHRGESAARTYAAEAAAALVAEDDAQIAKALEESWDDAAFSYVIVLRGDWTLAGKRVGRNFAGTVEEAIDAHTRNGLSPEPFRNGTDRAFTRPVAVVSRAAGKFGERNVGYVLLALNAADLERQLSDVSLRIFVLLTGGGLLLAVLVYLFVARLVLRPLDEMTAVARRVSDCDLTARADPR